MTVSDVQHVLDLRYSALLRYAHGVVTSTATDARTLATACVLVHRAAVWPVRATDEEEIYRVLRRRVLRRALRSGRRPWLALSRKARVEPEPVADRELLGDAGPVCRAILLLHLVDEMSIEDAETLVASLAPRGRDVVAAAAEAARRLLKGTTPSTVDNQSDGVRLRSPSIRHTRARWLGIGVAVLAVAVVAGVLVIPDAPPDLGVDVRAGAPGQPYVSCQLEWPTRGDALRSGAPLESPLVRRAVELWQHETKTLVVNTGDELRSRYTFPGSPDDVWVLFAGRTSENQQTVLLCQDDKLARYVESPNIRHSRVYPHLSTTTLPYLSRLDPTRRVPFVDLGAAWLVDPDATRVRATPVEVASPQWTDLAVDRHGVTKDITTAGASDDTACGTTGGARPTLVRVDLPRSPRHDKPDSFDEGAKSPEWVSAVHSGEQLSPHSSPPLSSLLPSMVWGAGATASDFRVLRAYSCVRAFDFDLDDPPGYIEIDELRVLASVPLPGQGTQVAFQAMVTDHIPDSLPGDIPEDSADERLEGGLTTVDGVGLLSDLGPWHKDAVAGWTSGPDDHWYYVAVGGADTARIQVTGAISGTTAGRALVLRGPKVGEDEDEGEGEGPALPVAVAFYDKRGTIIAAG